MLSFFVSLKLWIIFHAPSLMFHVWLFALKRKEKSCRINLVFPLFFYIVYISFECDSSVFVHHICYPLLLVPVYLFSSCFPSWMWMAKKYFIFNSYFLHSMECCLSKTNVNLWLAHYDNIIASSFHSRGQSFRVWFACRNLAKPFVIVKLSKAKFCHFEQTGDNW